MQEITILQIFPESCLPSSFFNFVVIFFRVFNLEKLPNSIVKNCQNPLFQNFLSSGRKNVGHG